LKLKKNYYEPSAQAEQNIKNNQADSPAVLPPAPSFRQRNSSQRLRQNMLFAASWFVFIALGSALIYIRFFSGLPGLAPDMLRQYGIIAVGIAYLVSVFLALKDNMFDGLLAIIIPFYPFYYLFLKSGAALLCALTAALLAAFGFDCVILINHHASILIDKVSALIQQL